MQRKQNSPFQGIKLEHNTEIPRNQSSSDLSLEFTKDSHLNHSSDLEEPLQSEKQLSDSQLSQFLGKSTRKRKNKAKPKAKAKAKSKGNSKSKRYSKNQSSMQKNPSKTQKQNKTASQKNPQTQFYCLKQLSNIGIDTSVSIQDELYTKNLNKKKTNKNKKQIKEQEIDQIKVLEQQKPEVKANESSEQSYELPCQIDIHSLVSKCQYHVIDFKSIYDPQKASREFRPQIDILYTLVPKYVTKQIQEKQIPQTMVLTGEKISESQELFVEMVKFYQNLSDLIDPDGFFTK